jgi:hypothetical protein
VKQSPFGTLSCIDHAGFYFKGFASIYSYDRTKDFYFNSSTDKVKGEGWEGGDDDEDDISVTLSRNANAEISGYLKYQLPTDCEDLVKIHREQRSDKKLKHDLVRNSVLSAVRKTAPLFTAEEAKMGYVGAYPYAEVKSGYTSFFLGARYICPTVTMEVTFTNSWYDEALEKEGATKLINDGCKLISQHADSMGAPTACEVAGVPDVSYNGSTVSACPNTFIISSRINWEPYFEYMVNCVMNGEAIAADWTGTIATGSVELSELNEQAAAAGTAEKIAEVKAALEDGSLKVYDINTFTVNGAKLESYLADVDDMGDYVPETEVVTDGYFHESEYRSAPYFDVDIDGITMLGA